MEQTSIVELEAENARTITAREYSKAYHLQDLRKFPGWSESRINWMERKDANNEQSPGDGQFTDQQIVFIHQDFTVTASVWSNENVIFNQVSDQWREFCLSELGFKVPSDLDEVGR